MSELTNTFGHSYFFLEELVMYLKKLLRENIEEDLFKDSIKSLENDFLIIIEDDKYYLKEMYEAEHLIVRRLKLLTHEEVPNYKKLDKSFDEIEKEVA